MISHISDAIADARLGKMFILIDDEDRENEGDLIVSAELITPEHIAFMAKQASGLVCLALEKKDLNAINIGPAPKRNQSKFGTGFTESIEARYGVTTGISAHDRVKTIQAAIGGNAEDISTPGHIFPLMAHEKGVLGRQGHTEGSIEIMKLANLKPAAVICEILNDDGTMARLNDIEIFAAKYDLKIITIASIVEYYSTLNWHC